MARRARNQRRGRNKSQVNWLAVGIGIFVVAALGAMFLLSAGNAPKVLDDITLCIEGESHPATLGIIIDSTDAIPSAPAAKVYHLVTSAVAELPVNSRIKLFQIKGGSTFLDPLVDICKPDDGADASQFTSSPAYIKKIYEERFSIPLDEALRNLIEAEPQNSSPIIEGIQAASVKSLMPFQSVAEKRLIIASDFLQHSTLYSMYRERPDLSEFTDQTQTSSLGRINLYGAKVDLLVIPRPIPNGNRSDLVTFWRDFLIQHNAALGSSLEPL